MDSKQVKRWCDQQLGLRCRTRTTPTKSAWITAWIPGGYDSRGRRVEGVGEFPVRFRQICLGVIYGEDSPLAKQTSAGNVGARSIAMPPAQWERATVKYEVEVNSWVR